MHENLCQSDEANGDFTPPSSPPKIDSDATSLISGEDAYEAGDDRTEADEADAMTMDSSPGCDVPLAEVRFRAVFGAVGFGLIQLSRQVIHIDALPEIETDTRYLPDDNECGSPNRSAAKKKSNGNPTTLANETINDDE